MSSILITGGTGSFGQAFVALLLKNNIYSRICIYSRDEHKQESMQRKFNDERLRFFIGDVRDKDRFRFAINSIEHIIHAAALKIVPTAEYNPFEAVKTNILGAQNLIECVLERGEAYPIERTRTKVLALSTDKAVRPINLYGATKLCAEKMFIAANNVQGENGAAFSVIRYGNVANSNGSVIPLFKKQRDAGEPITVTDARMTRFWITLEDAAEFVYLKLQDMQGGETFIPPMPSFNVMDLAMCYGDNIKITGVRPGEKIHEQISEEISSDNNDVWLDKPTLGLYLHNMGQL